MASTTALKQPDTAAGNLKYDSIETQIANLTSQRNVVAGAIRARVERRGQGIREASTRATRRTGSSQGQRLLDAAAALAAAS